MPLNHEGNEKVSPSKVGGPGGRTLSVNSSRPVSCHTPRIRFQIDKLDLICPVFVVAVTVDGQQRAYDQRLSHLVVDIFRQYLVSTDQSTPNHIERGYSENVSTQRLVGKQSFTRYKIMAGQRPIRINTFVPQNVLVIDTVKI